MPPKKRNDGQPRRKYTKKNAAIPNQPGTSTSGTAQHHSLHYPNPLQNPGIPPPSPRPYGGEQQLVQQHLFDRDLRMRQELYLQQLNSARHNAMAAMQSPVPGNHNGVYDVRVSPNGRAMQLPMSSPAPAITDQWEQEQLKLQQQQLQQQQNRQHVQISHPQVTLTPNGLPLTQEQLRHDDVQRRKEDYERRRQEHHQQQQMNQMVNGHNAMPSTSQQFPPGLGNQVPNSPNYQAPMNQMMRMMSPRPGGGFIPQQFPQQQARHVSRAQQMNGGAVVPVNNVIPIQQNNLPNNPPQSPHHRSLSLEGMRVPIPPTLPPRPADALQLQYLSLATGQGRQMHPSGEIPINRVTPNGGVEPLPVTSPGHHRASPPGAATPGMISPGQPNAAQPPQLPMSPPVPPQLTMTPPPTLPQQQQVLTPEESEIEVIFDRRLSHGSSQGSSTASSPGDYAFKIPSVPGTPGTPGAQGKTSKDQSKKKKNKGQIPPPQVPPQLHQQPPQEPTRRLQGQQQQQPLHHALPPAQPLQQQARGHAAPQPPSPMNGQPSARAPSPVPQPADKKMWRFKSNLSSRRPVEVEQPVVEQRERSPDEMPPPPEEEEPRSLPPRPLTARQQQLLPTLRRTSLPAVAPRDDTTSSSKKKEREREQAARGRVEKKVERKITPAPVISPLAPAAPAAQAAPIVRTAWTSRLPAYCLEPIRRAEEQTRNTAALQQSYPRRHPSVPAVPHQPSADITIPSPFAGTTAAVSPARADQSRAGRGRAISVERNPSLYLRGTSITRHINHEEEAERLAPLPPLSSWFNLWNEPVDLRRPSVAIVPPQAPAPLPSSVPLPAHPILDLTDSDDPSDPGPSNGASVTVHSSSAPIPSTSTASSSSAGPLPAGFRPTSTSSPNELWRSLNSISLASSPAAAPSDFSARPTNPAPVFFDPESTPDPSGSAPGPSDIYPISRDFEEQIADNDAAVVDGAEEKMEEQSGGMEEPMEEEENANDDFMEKKMDKVDDIPEPIEPLEGEEDVDLDFLDDVYHEAILEGGEEVPMSADLEAMKDQERKDDVEPVRNKPISDEELVLVPSTSSAAGVPQIADNDDAAADEKDRDNDNDENEVPASGDPVPLDGMEDDHQAPSKIDAEEPACSASVADEVKDPIEGEHGPTTITDPSDEVIVEEVSKDLIDGEEKKAKTDEDDSNLTPLQITIPHHSVEIPSEESIPFDTEDVVKEEPIELEETEEEDETQPFWRSRSLSYAVIVEDRKEIEQKSYHAPLRSGASPTPSGSSVSSPPSPNEPRLEITGDTRNLLTPDTVEDDKNTDKKPHERPPRITMEKHDDDGKAFADSSLSDTPVTAQFDGRPPSFVFNDQTVAVNAVARVEDDYMNNIAGDSVNQNKDDEEVGNSGEDQGKEAEKRNKRCFSSSSLNSHGQSFEDSESDREPTPDNAKASDGVRDDNASDEKEEEFQVPHCPLPVVRSVSFLGEDMKEKKDDEENNDNNDGGPHTETRSDHFPSHYGIKSDEEVESTSSLSLVDSSELPTENKNADEDEDKNKEEQDEEEIDASQSDSTIATSSSFSLPDDNSQKLPKEDDCETDKEDDKESDGTAQEVPAVEGQEYTSIASQSIPDASTVSDDDEEKEEPMLSPAPSAPKDDDEMETPSALSPSVAHGSDESCSTESTEVAEIETSSGETVSLESSTSPAPRETSIPPVDPSATEETKEAPEPSIEEKDVKEEEAIVPQSNLFLAHNGEPSKKMDWTTVTTSPIVTGAMRERSANPEPSDDDDNVRIEDDAGDDEGNEVTDVSMTSLYISTPKPIAVPLLAIEWTKPEKAASSSSTTQEEEAHPAEDNDVMEIEVLEEVDEWKAEDEQEEMSEKKDKEDEKEKQEIPDEPSESPEWRKYQFFVEDKEDEDTTPDGAESINKDAVSTSMLIPSTSSFIPPVHPCPIVDDQSDGEQKEEIEENPMDQLQSTASTQSSIEETEETISHGDAQNAAKPSDEQPAACSNPSENPQRKVSAALCSITEYGSDDDEEEEEHTDSVDLPIYSSSSTERVEEGSPLENDVVADEVITEKAKESSENDMGDNSILDPSISPVPPIEPIDDIEMEDDELIEEDVIDENDEEAIEEVKEDDKNDDGLNDEERDEKDDEIIEGVKDEKIFEDEDSAVPRAIDAIEEHANNGEEKDTEKEEKEISPEEEEQLLHGEGGDGAIYITPEEAELLLHGMSFIPPPTVASVAQTTSSTPCDDTENVEKPKKEEKVLEEVEQEEGPIEDEEISPPEEMTEEIKDDALLTLADLTDSSPHMNETPSSSTIPTDLYAITEESVEGDDNSKIEEISEVIEDDDAPLSPLDHHLPCTPSLLERASPPQTPDSPDGEDEYLEEKEKEKGGDDESTRTPIEHHLPYTPSLIAQTPESPEWQDELGDAVPEGKAEQEKALQSPVTLPITPTPILEASDRSPLLSTTTEGDAEKDTEEQLEDDTPPEVKNEEVEEKDTIDLPGPPGQSDQRTSPASPDDSTAAETENSKIKNDDEEEEDEGDEEEELEEQNEDVEIGIEGQSDDESQQFSTMSSLLILAKNAVAKIPENEDEKEEEQDQPILVEQRAVEEIYQEEKKDLSDTPPNSPCYDGPITPYAEQTLSPPLSVDDKEKKEDLKGKVEGAIEDEMEESVEIEETTNEDSSSLLDAMPSLVNDHTYAKADSDENLASSDFESDETEESEEEEEQETEEKLEDPILPPTRPKRVCRSKIGSMKEPEGSSEDEEDDEDDMPPVLSPQMPPEVSTEVSTRYRAEIGDLPPPSLPSSSYLPRPYDRLPSSHSPSHPDLTLCPLCKRSFSSQAGLQKHLETCAKRFCKSFYIKEKDEEPEEEEEEEETEENMEEETEEEREEVEKGEEKEEKKEKSGRKKVEKKGRRMSDVSLSSHKTSSSVDEEGAKDQAKKGDICPACGKAFSCREMRLHKWNCTGVKKTEGQTSNRPQPIPPSLITASVDTLLQRSTAVGGISALALPDGIFRCPMCGVFDSLNRKSVATHILRGHSEADKERYRRAQQDHERQSTSASSRSAKEQKKENEQRERSPSHSPEPFDHRAVCAELTRVPPTDFALPPAWRREEELVSRSHMAEERRIEEEMKKEDEKRRKKEETERKKRRRLEKNERRRLKDIVDREKKNKEKEELERKEAEEEEKMKEQERMEKEKKEAEEKEKMVQIERKRLEHEERRKKDDEEKKRLDEEKRKREEAAQVANRMEEERRLEEEKKMKDQANEKKGRGRPPNAARRSGTIEDTDLEATTSQKETKEVDVATPSRTPSKKLPKSKNVVVEAAASTSAGDEDPSEPSPSHTHSRRRRSSTLNDESEPTEVIQSTSVIRELPARGSARGGSSKKKTMASTPEDCHQVPTEQTAVATPYCSRDVRSLKRRQDMDEEKKADKTMDDSAPSTSAATTGGMEEEASPPVKKRPGRKPGPKSEKKLDEQPSTSSGLPAETPSEDGQTVLQSTRASRQRPIGMEEPITEPVATGRSGMPRHTRSFIAPAASRLTGVTRVCRSGRNDPGDDTPVAYSSSDNQKIDPLDVPSDQPSTSTPTIRGRKKKAVEEHITPPPSTSLLPPPAMNEETETSSSTPSMRGRNKKMDKKSEDQPTTTPPTLPSLPPPSLRGRRAVMIEEKEEEPSTTSTPKRGRKAKCEEAREEKTRESTPSPPPPTVPSMPTRGRPSLRNSTLEETEEPTRGRKRKEPIEEKKDATHQKKEERRERDDGVKRRKK